MSVAPTADGGLADVTRSRVLRVMAARLFICIGALVLALMLVGAGRLHSEAAEVGLYGTLGAAFLATAVYAAFLPWVDRLGAFARFQIAGDLLLVTSLVTFSGGADSIFSFLYLPVVVFAALLFDKVGAYVTAASGAVGYASAILSTGYLGASALGSVPMEIAFSLWGLHTGAMLLVALFASGLSGELRIAGQRLEESATDLAELRTLHQRTVESLTSGVLTADPEDRLSSFNPEAERITGLTADEAIGRPLSEVLPGLGILVEQGASPGRARARFRFVDPDGDERFLGVAMSDLRTAGGESTGRVVIFQDVTDVVRMEAELSRNARLAGIGELAASIAHEIRNPLAAISGSVEMLRSTMPAEDEAAHGNRLMKIVLREIDRLNHLITDFLRYARPAPAKLQDVDLCRLVRDVVEAFRAGLEPGIEIQLDAEGAAVVAADFKQIEQVVWNLLGNAQQAMEDGGLIRVGVSGSDARGERPSEESQDGASNDRNGTGESARLVELEISDTGAGIGEGLLERIFDPFFTTRSQGTGLGLATVHRIVENHGGTVQVTSSVGQGTTFRVGIPSAEGAR